MGHPLRYLPYPGCLVEVTAQTFQGRKLLRPDPEVTDIILGILGVGIEHFPEVNLVNYQYMSNHPHIITAPQTIEDLSGFMCFVQSNISREIGTRIRDWPGTFWHDRYEATPIIDDAAGVARLRYLLENSVKENLVATIEDWPGANGVRTALGGPPEVGTWYDRTAEYYARRRVAGESTQELDPSPFARRVEVPLKPLPAWSHLPEQEQAQLLRDMLGDIRDEHAAKRARLGIGLLGVEAVLAADPIARPEKVERREGTFCHASSRRLREAFYEVLTALTDAYACASKAFRVGDRGVEFPQGTFRPLGGFVPWTDETAASPLEWIEGLSPA